VELILPERRPVNEADLRDLYASDRSRPRVRVNFVSSLDGAVEVEGRSRALSGEADRAVFRLLRQLSDAIMVGAGTVRQEGYGPARVDPDVAAGRVGAGLPEQPTMVIVSASLDLDHGARIFVEAPVRPIVLTHDGAPTDRRAALETVADVVSCGPSVVDLAAGLADLHRRGLREVLCEGGPHLFGALLAADLVDELCLTVSPLLVGDGPGRIVAGGTRDEPARMSLAHLIAAEGMLLTRYRRVEPAVRD
jgi:riboflavin-specific deaminase-like protein